MRDAPENPDWFLPRHSAAHGSGAETVRAGEQVRIRLFDPIRHLSGDSVELHAWAEVFIPGASWIGLDTTSDLFTSEGHISLAIGPDPEQVAPVERLTEQCLATMSYRCEVIRLNDLH